MTYLVLARKWRPKSFAELVGQQHVSRALMHALKEQRLHHAYLFTGTRGVGKTTIARILAKCLNCEQGIVAEPCGSCSTCTEIDAGHFPDLIEVDAASRTRVEETRELLENVAYAPVRGRYKIYLIDEVHMLSTGSFNALLKTLEEPPEHVKFVFATTNPDKMPVTVLSRCLHFHLRPITVNELNTQLSHILTTEQIDFEPQAINMLANAANGSLRDSLSLLEQAIASGGGSVEAQSVANMLGLVNQSEVLPLVEALCDKNSTEVFTAIDKLAQNGANFERVLEAIISSMHAFSMAQMVPDAKAYISSLSDVDDELLALHSKLSPEQTQLYYQIALQGKRDFAIMPNQQQSLEMILLRMLSFQPFELPQQAVASAPVAAPAPTPSPATAPVRAQAAPTSAPAPISDAPMRPVVKPSPVQQATAAPVAQLVSSDQPSNWRQLVTQLPLTGLVKILAQHCVINTWDLPKVHLTLEKAQSPLLNSEREKQIGDALSQHLGQQVKVTIDTGDVKQQSPAKLVQAENKVKHNKAEEVLANDKVAQSLVDTFDAQLNNLTILDEKTE